MCPCRLPGTSHVTTVTTKKATTNKMFTKKKGETILTTNKKKPTQNTHEKTQTKHLTQTEKKNKVVCKNTTQHAHARRAYLSLWWGRPNVGRIRRDDPGIRHRRYPQARHRNKPQCQPHRPEDASPVHRKPEHKVARDIKRWREAAREWVGEWLGGWAGG